MTRRIVSTQLQAASTEAAVDGYFDKIVKYIPADIVGAYVFAAGAIEASSVDEKNRVLWLVFAALLIMTPIWTLRMTVLPGKSPALLQAAVSTGAFAVWVFALGGPFADLSWYDYLYGSLVLALYTLLSGLVTPRE